jgi:hypothetical protein
MKIYELNTLTTDNQNIRLVKAENIDETYIEAISAEGTNKINISLRAIAGELIKKGIIGISLNSLIEKNHFFIMVEKIFSIRITSHRITI